MPFVCHVRRLEASDAAEIASLHCKAFKDFFLSSLGESFLKVFYKAILFHQNGVGIGIYVGSNLAGFAIGTKNITGFYRSLVNSRGLGLLIAALPKLIIAPFKAKRLLASLFASNNTEYTNLPSLLSICVSPDYGSQGLGKKLLKEFEMELINNHCHSVLLTTNSHDNDYVNQFYTRNKYICTQSFFQGEREMNLYYKKI